MIQRSILLAGLFCTLSLSLSAQSSHIEWIVWEDDISHWDIAISPNGKQIATTTLSTNQPQPLIRVYSTEEGELDGGGNLLHTITNQQVHSPYNTLYSYYTTFGFVGDNSLFVHLDYLDTVSNVFQTAAVRINVDGEQFEEVRHFPTKGTSLPALPALYGAGLFIYRAMPSGNGIDSIFGINLFENSSHVYSNQYPISVEGNTLPVTLSTDGSTAVFRQRDRYWIVETATGNVVGEQTFSGDWELTTLLPGNRSMAFLTYDNTMKILNFETGKIERRIVSGDLYIQYHNGNPSIETAFSPDGNYFAISRPDGTIHVWNLQTGQKLHVYDEYLGFYTALAFTPDSKHLISLTKDGAVISWRTSSLVSGVEETTGQDIYNGTLATSASLNPTSQTARFTFTLPERSDVRVNLYNVRGEVVGRFTKSSVEPGEHSEEWNVGEIPTGVYFYRLSAGERIGTGRLVVQ